MCAEASSISSRLASDPLLDCGFPLSPRPPRHRQIHQRRSIELLITIATDSGLKPPLASRNNSIIFNSNSIMPPFRNPFGRKPPIINGIPTTEDGYPRPSEPNGLEKGSPRPGYASSRASSSLSITKKEEPSEYKLSGMLD